MPRQSKHSAENRQDISPETPDETPQFHFRGVWVNRALLDMVCAGTVTRKELVVILVIDALTKPKGEGCFASKSYIAAAVKCHPCTVQAAIKKLKKLGLVRSFWWGGKRHLRVVYPEG